MTPVFKKKAIARDKYHNKGYYHIELHFYIKSHGPNKQEDIIKIIHNLRTHPLKNKNLAFAIS